MRLANEISETVSNVLKLDRGARKIGKTERQEAASARVTVGPSL